MKQFSYNPYATRQSNDILYSTQIHQVNYCSLVQTVLSLSTRQSKFQIYVKLTLLSGQNTKIAWNKGHNQSIEDKIK